MDMDMDVLIPQKTNNQIGMKGNAADGRYKTMYLLHGMSDDQTTCPVFAGSFSADV